MYQIAFIKCLQHHIDVNEIQNYEHWHQSSRNRRDIIKTADKIKSDKKYIFLNLGQQLLSENDWQLCQFMKKQDIVNTVFNTNVKLRVPNLAFMIFLKLPPFQLHSEENWTKVRSYPYEYLPNGLR